MTDWLKRHRTLLINLFVFMGFLYLIIPRFDQFKTSFLAIQDADPVWIIFAIIVYFTGMPLMAMQLNAIAIKPLCYFITYKVQMAALFVNRVLPSNIGLVLLNTYYLKKYNHSNTETATVISVSALTSAFAFISIIAIGLIVGQGSKVVESANIAPPRGLMIGVAIAFLAVALLIRFSPTIRKKIIKPIKDIRHQLSEYRRRPKDIITAIFGNGAATMTSVITLFACAMSLNTPITLSLALITYVLGNTLGGLIPTPGGLGGVDAGLYAGLVLGGVSSVEALPIVLLYRFITYWIALIPGVFFFLWLRKDVLATFTLSTRQ